MGECKGHLHTEWVLSGVIRSPRTALLLLLLRGRVRKRGSCMGESEREGEGEKLNIEKLWFSLGQQRRTSFPKGTRTCLSGIQSLLGDFPEVRSFY